jgi:hypothetical protein
MVLVLFRWERTAVVVVEQAKESVDAFGMMAQSYLSALLLEVMQTI